MKKSLIALAVAGAMTAPMIAQADATLYGSFRIKAQQVEDGDLNLADDSSRIGIKGDVDLGLDGTKGLFHWEANIDTVDNDSGVLKDGDDPLDGIEADGSDTAGDMFAARLAYIGATGDWGTALVGRQYHPHFLWINLPVLMFNDGGIGERSFLGNDQHKRVDNTLAYMTPVMGGFQAVAGFVIAGDSNDNDGNFDETVDGYNIAAKYSGAGLTAAISYGDVDTNSGSVGVNNVDVETLGVAVTYTVDALTVAGRYETQDTANVDEDVWALGATYKMGDTSLMARYTDYETDTANSDSDQFAIGVQQIMGKGRVYAEAAFNDNDANTDKDIYTLGYRVDF